jgi:hypothetical protein
VTLPAGERRALAWAGAAVWITRLPWIAHDYGSDPDSYRVVISARHLLRTGDYQPSRLPGFPVYESLNVLTAQASPWAANSVTALFSVIACVLLALVLRELKLRHYLLLALGFAMVPVVYIGSCCTMDYVPSLAFALGSLYAVLRRRPAAAGILLGLAAGCRITAAALALPLCLWMFLSCAPAQALRSALRFAAAACVTGALCFAPLYRLYGTGFFTFFDNDGYPPASVVWARATTLVWGQIGAAALLALLCSLPFWRAHIRRSMQEPARRHMLWVALLAVALYLLAFLRLPDEAGYLIPMVPWVLVAAAVLAPDAALTALSIALLLSPWFAFHAGSPSLEGPILEDYRVRESQDQATHAVIAAVSALPGRAAIVCGWILPRITLALDGDALGLHQFIYLVDDDEDFRRYLKRGMQIYYLPGVDLYESQAHQLELPTMGARQLDVPRERQRPDSTGE